MLDGWEKKIASFMICRWPFVKFCQLSMDKVQLFDIDTPQIVDCFIKVESDADHFC